MMRALLSALLFLSSGPAAQAANDIAQIQQGLDSPVIVDVRSEGEYASGAIDGALNHPLQGLPGTLLDWASNSMRKSLCTAKADAVRLKQKPCSSKPGFS